MGAGTGDRDRGGSYSKDEGDRDKAELEVRDARVAADSEDLVRVALGRLAFSAGVSWMACQRMVAAETASRPARQEEDRWRIRELTRP